jgi:N-acetyl-anhydromuramyl-L-alanine amidase AmpD
MWGRPTREKVAEVRRWHVQDRGWKDIGYHFLIDRDGTLAEGRPIDQVGAHTAGHNTGTIGVCLFGGFGSAATDNFFDNFTQEQDKALRDVLKTLSSTYPIKKVSGHNEYAAKACPSFSVTKWFGKT